MQQFVVTYDGRAKVRVFLTDTMVWADKLTKKHTLLPGESIIDVIDASETVGNKRMVARQLKSLSRTFTTDFEFQRPDSWIEDRDHLFAQRFQFGFLMNDNNHFEAKNTESQKYLVKNKFNESVARFRTVPCMPWGQLKIQMRAATVQDIASRAKILEDVFDDKIVAREIMEFFFPKSFAGSWEKIFDTKKRKTHFALASKKKKQKISKN